MKATVLFIFLFLILFFALLPGVTNTIVAQTISPSLTPSVSLSPSPTPVDYQLPYPGLLPDNPLYKLKTFRDRIVFFLISDPLKKAQFDLLQADKRLNAAWYLLQGKTANNQLVIDTLSKGQNYFFQGLSELALAKRQGLVTADMLHQFFLSGLKHKEVFMQMQKIMPQVADQLKNESQRLEVSLKQIRMSK